MDLLQIKNDFIQLLGELKGLDKNSEWRKVKASISSDPRYEAVQGSHRREALFEEYVEKMQVSDNLYSFSLRKVYLYLSLITSQRIKRLSGILYL